MGLNGALEDVKNPMLEFNPPPAMSNSGGLELEPASA
jgi:hypothetical protein